MLKGIYQKLQLDEPELDIPSEPANTTFDGIEVPKISYTTIPVYFARGYIEYSFI